MCRHPGQSDTSNTGNWKKYRNHWGPKGRPTLEGAFVLRSSSLGVCMAREEGCPQDHQFALGLWWKKAPQNWEEWPPHLSHQDGASKQDALCIWVWTTFPWQSWLQDLVPQELSLHQHRRNRSGYFQGRQTVVTRLPAKNIYLEWVLSLTHWAQVTALLSAVISDS